MTGAEKDRATIWSAAQSDMIESRVVREAVGRLLAFGIRRGRRCLALVPRIESATRIAREVERDVRQSVPAIDGTKDDADVLIARLTSGAVNAAVATRLGDEGLDVPELDLLVSAQSGRAKGGATQRAGRVCRPAGAAVPLVFDIVAGDGMFASQWRDRRSAYRAEYGDGALVAKDPMTLDEAIVIAEKIVEGHDWRR